jgi:cell division septum initiation protein DivIVA
MSEPENSSIPPGSGSKPESQPKVKPAATLAEFLRAEKASPRPFLASARKITPASPSEFDVHELGVYLDTHEPALQRLAHLLAELPDEQSVIARQVTQIAEGYARRQVPQISWPHLRFETKVDQVKEVIRSLLSTGLDPHKQRKGQTAAFFVLWIARLRGLVDGEALADLLLFAFPPKLKTQAKGGQSEKVDLGAVLAPVLNKRALRDPVLATAIYYRAKAASLVNEAHALEAEVAKLKQDIARHEETIAGFNEQAARDKMLLKQKDQHAAQLVQDITDHKAVARQSAQRLKARLNGLLRSELLPLLRDVHDSSTMEPVRTHIILDRVETARKLIEKESLWLESSD